MSENSDKTKNGESNPNFDKVATIHDSSKDLQDDLKLETKIKEKEIKDNFNSYNFQKRNEETPIYTNDASIKAPVLFIIPMESPNTLESAYSDEQILVVKESSNKKNLITLRTKLWTQSLYNLF